jgi:hypothetical protein
MKKIKVVVAGLASSLTGEQIHEAFSLENIANGELKEFIAEVFGEVENVRLLDEAHDGNLRALITFVGKKECEKEEVESEVREEDKLKCFVDPESLRLKPFSDSDSDPDPDPDPKSKLDFYSPIVLTKLPEGAEPYSNEEAYKNAPGIHPRILKVIFEYCRQSGCSITIRASNPAGSRLIDLYRRNAASLRYPKPMEVKEQTVRDGIFAGSVGVQLAKRLESTYPKPAHAPARNILPKDPKFCSTLVRKSAAEIRGLIEGGCLDANIEYLADGSYLVPIKSSGSIARKLSTEYKAETGQKPRYLCLMPTKGANSYAKSQPGFDSRTGTQSGDMDFAKIASGKMFKVYLTHQAYGGLLIAEKAIVLDEEKHIVVPLGPDLDIRSKSDPVGTKTQYSRTEYDFSQDPKVLLPEIFAAEASLTKEDRRDITEAAKKLSGIGQLKEILELHRLGRKIADELKLFSPIQHMCDRANPHGSKPFEKDLLVLPDGSVIVCRDDFVSSEILRDIVLYNRMASFKKTQKAELPLDARRLSVSWDGTAGLPNAGTPEHSPEEVKVRGGTKFSLSQVHRVHSVFARPEGTAPLIKRGEAREAGRSRLASITEEGSVETDGIPGTPPLAFGGLVGMR